MRPCHPSQPGTGRMSADEHCLEPPHPRRGVGDGNGAPARRVLLALSDPVAAGRLAKVTYLSTEVAPASETSRTRRQIRRRSCTPQMPASSASRSPGSSTGRSPSATCASTGSSSRTGPGMYSTYPDLGNYALVVVDADFVRTEGSECLDQVRKASDTPIVAIGGIEEDHHPTVDFALDSPDPFKIARKGAALIQMGRPVALPHPQTHRDRQRLCSGSQSRRATGSMPGPHSWSFLSADGRPVDRMPRCLRPSACVERSGSTRRGGVFGRRGARGGFRSLWTMSWRHSTPEGETDS